MSDPDLRHARIRITLTPPLTMVAQDADAAGISLAALLSADVHRGRYLALNAWRALDISHGDRGRALRRRTAHPVGGSKRPARRRAAPHRRRL